MLWRYLFAAFAFTAAPMAEADTWTPHADIVCSRNANIAIIRFGGASNDGPTEFRKLPSRLDGGLSRSRATKETDCSLPNGWQLRLRDRQKQAFPYGEGGADPPAFFSLWINRQRIFSAKEWKPGYTWRDYSELTALIIRANRLTWCRAVNDGPQHCQSEPFRLDNRYRIDTAEYPRNGRKWKVGTLLATSIGAPAGFCRRYAEVMQKKMLDDVAFTFALYGHDEAPFAWDILRQAKSLSDRAPIWQVDADIAPGVRRRILIKHGESHFFDGDVVLVLPQGTDTTKLVPKLDFDDQNPNRVTLGERSGWTELFGGTRDIYPEVSPRYVHFFPERIDGRAYFLASPSNVESRPTAILVGIRPEGGYRVMCRIQRIEPHF